jgi:hypothetical protein
MGEHVWMGEGGGRVFYGQVRRWRKTKRWWPVGQQVGVGGWGSEVRPA